MAASTPRRRATVRRWLMALAGAGLWLAAATTPASASGALWPKYLHDNGGSGYTGNGGLTVEGARNLKAVPGWPVQLGGTISTQPVLANNLIYVGAWDGYEYALTTSGAIQWRRFLGITTKGKACQYPIGVAGTAVVAQATVGKGTRSVLYVGGGGNADSAGKTFDGGTAQLFALDALTGSILWQTSLGASPDHFIWSSPASYRGSIYVGVSAFADCPLIQGQLVQVDAATGKVAHTFNVVPDGCTGGSVWGSPSIDERDGSVYIATGNGATCSIFGSQVGSSVRPKRAAATGALAVLGLMLAGFAWPRRSIRGLFWTGLGVAIAGFAATSLLLVGPQLHRGEPYAQAVVKLSATDLAPLGRWQVPAAEATVDSDFGSTPTLFSGSVMPGGASRALLGVANKNGLYYVFDRGNLDGGPVARLRIADGGNPPTSGNGSISPSAFDGARLYIGGGHIAIDGRLVPGTVSAYDPSDLRAPVWRTGIGSGPVLGAVTAVPGLAVAGAGSSIIVLDTTRGAIVFTTSAGGGSAARPAIFYGAATIAGGVLYEGDTHGRLYAYAAG